MVNIRMIAAVAMAAALLVVGISFESPRKAAAGNGAGPDTTCTSPAPCLSESNTSTGPAISGDSKKGPGIIGQTKFNSTSRSNGQPGVVGQDLSSRGKFNFGVLGSSPKGTAVAGNSTSGQGVLGSSTTGFGTVGTSVNPFVVPLITTQDGVVGQTSFTPIPPSTEFAAGVLGQDFGTAPFANAGVLGTSADSEGVFGIGYTGDGVLGQAVGTGNGVAGLGSGVVGISSVAGFGVWGIDGSAAGSGSAGVRASSGNNYGLFVVGQSSSKPAVLIDETVAQFATDRVMIAKSDITGDLMSLAGNGDMIVKGTLTANGSPLILSQTNSGRPIVTFSGQETSPSVEDAGEAQLVGGQASVRIDPTFASAMDPHVPYLVFITPEGDSNGLFVTSKTASSFVVRENRGGTSNVQFSYRIVGKPFGIARVRLPYADSITAIRQFYAKGFDETRHISNPKWHPIGRTNP
ncbi:MAG TPA: hypothetical protein VII69_09390 [Candidatus Eremiobacteraceae bacterium]